MSTEEDLSASAGVAVDEPVGNQDFLTFVCFDPRREASSSFISSLRNIHENLRFFADRAMCFDFIRSTDNKIFFLALSMTNEMLISAQQCMAIEAIFVLDAEGSNLRSDLPKVFGIFNQHEQMLFAIKENFDLFHSIHLEIFELQKEPNFFWWQIWKEKVNLVADIDVKSRYFD
jgi:hypothetical protein